MLMDTESYAIKQEVKHSFIKPIRTVERFLIEKEVLLLLLLLLIIIIILLILITEY
jgi:hypothetical protein